MKAEKTIERAERKQSEKGAAMVMVLMITSVLLVASIGLILETSMNAANVTDATAEQQAYNSAESGIQSALNVLRGNVDPDVNFIKALKASTSNAAGDTSTTPRLSKWITYQCAASGTGNTDRVLLGTDDCTNLKNGYSYSLALSDPDNTGDSITFSTSGKIDGSSLGKVWNGTGINALGITYNARSSTTLDISSGSINDNLGNFSVVKVGTGSVTIPTDVRFQINYKMTNPYEVVEVVRGTIKAGTINSVSDVIFQYDSPAYVIMGSKITLSGGTVTTNPIGYRVTGATTTTVSCSITPVEPHRVLLRATGYGPRGAEKQLEAIVQKNFFNGLSAPATLTLVGSSDGFVFNPGTSAAMEYSGDDVVSNVIIPPIGTSNDDNLATVNTELCDCPPQPYNGEVFGTPSNVSEEMPYWLQSPTNLDATIQNLRNTAKSSGRYFANGDAMDNDDGFGDNVNAKGITFVDGDVEINQDGGGILVVTGKLTLKGAFKFNGLIIVTGADGVERDGGGNGIIQGNIVVAPYDPSNLSADFLAPKYDLDGGGTSEVVYNSSSVANGLIAVSNFVLGVVEK